MKARAAIYKTLVEECLGKGMSLRATAVFLALPVGTVKTWRHRSGGRRAKGEGGEPLKPDMKPTMKPAPEQGKAADMKPDMKPVQRGGGATEAGKAGRVHRGLTVDMMPGKTGWERRMTFSLFTRGKWPPKEWRIPATLEDLALVAELAERAAKSKPGRVRGNDETRRRNDE